MIEGLLSALVTNIAPIAMSESAKFAANIGTKFVITAASTAGTCIVNKAIDEGTAERAAKLLKEKGCITTEDAEQLTNEGIAGKAFADGGIAAAGLAAIYFASKAINASK